MLRLLVGGCGVRVCGNGTIVPGSLSPCQFRSIGHPSSRRVKPFNRPFSDWGHSLQYPQIDRQAQDIVPEDLSATLAAHRASNRASIIRYTQVKPQEWDDAPTYFRPLVQDGSVDFDQHLVPARTPGALAHHDKAETREQPPAATDPTETPAVSFDHSRHFIHDGSKVRGLRSHPKKRNNAKEKGAFEYEPRYFRPLTRSSPEPKLPWIVGVDYGNLDGMERLSAEIRAFVAYMTPTPAEQAARAAVISDVQTYCQDYMPECTLELYGSQKTSLSSPLSDIDFRLCHPDLDKADGARGPSLTRPARQKTMLKRLQALLKLFSDNEAYRSCEIRYARYPLLSVRHRATSIEVQIVSCNDTVASREYIKSHVAEHPSLPALFTVTKAVLVVRGLSDVFRGGLGSYSIFMMVVASLKLNAVTDPTDLGRQLLNFLWFWSRLDNYRFGVSVEPPCVFRKRPSTAKATKGEREEMNDDPVLLGRHELSVIQQDQPYLMCLQDPADATNDLGRKCYSIKHIKITFEHLLRRVLELIGEGKPASFLAPLVGTDFVKLARRRKILAAFGTKILLRAEKVESTDAKAMPSG